MKQKAPGIIYVGLFPDVCRALLNAYRVLLNAYRALLNAYRALLNAYRALCM